MNHYKLIYVKFRAGFNWLETVHWRALMSTKTNVEFVVLAAAMLKI
jgi:hypothetical protein